MAKKAAAAAAPPKTYASAMDKLRDEMAENAGSRYVQVVGEYLTDYLLNHPEAEAAILTDGKSIKGSLSAMEAEARKVKTGSVAVLDDQTAFGIVRGYFGIAEAEDVSKKAENVSKKAEDVSKRVEDVSKKSEDVSKKAEDVPETQPDPIDPFDLDALMGVM